MESYLCEAKEGTLIKSMNHTGFVVKDLDKSITFYRDIMGLELTSTYEREGEPISQVVGYKSAHLKIAILSIEDGHKLELIQYMYPSGSECIELERNALGSTHLAFNVENIDETSRELVRQGAIKLNPPVVVAPGKVACYMQDPDGNWIELMEYPE